MGAAVEFAYELSSFIPADRRQTMASGGSLPERQEGVVLFADIGGFTPLAESLEHELGPKQGAEALASFIDRIFDALAEAVHRYHGSIVSLAGDSITCWFDDEHRPAAVACALEMQEAMSKAGATASGAASPTLKVALAYGEARRALVGDPETQLFDVLFGAVVDRAGACEKECRPGEVMVDRRLAEALGKAVSPDEGGAEFLRVTGLRDGVAADPWSPLPAGVIHDQIVRAWIPPTVYERLQAGHGRFLAEFRPVVAEFVSFAGIDYEDAEAGRTFDVVLRRIQAVLARNGGTISDISTGDKGSYLLAVFGAPVAHGDHVRRAATAANELHRSGEEGLRIGLHTGRAYTGLYSGRFRSAYAVAGDAVNLAARLMTHAEPGQVLMSAALGAALDRRFSIQPLEPIGVKGRAAPVAVCELVGSAPAGSSLSEPRYTLPIVGRTRELAAIDAALAEAGEGRGGVLAFCAEAGMGKSRLVSAALQRAGDRGFATFAGECQPQGTGIAYLPWQPVWNAVLGLPVDEPDDVRREALTAALADAAPATVPLAPLLASALDLPLADNDATRSMPAPVRKQLLEQILTGTLRGRAERGPVCVALEDLHWVDALSRDLLAALAAAVVDRPVLFVLSYRLPERESPIPIPHGRELALTELSADDASALATMLLGQLTEDEPDPAAVVTIAERAQGNPFYVEELVREIVERGGSTSDLPGSLENLILERIDRLTPGQQLTARVASVIGRRFATEWLAGAYAGTLDSTRLAADLEGLSAAGLIVADTPAPDETYIFRHVVVRDVAYGTLGSRLREDLHERLASHLEQSFEAPPVDLLAYHYACSANSAKEALYRRLAAEVAIRNGAYGDALTHVRRAREIVEAQPEGPERLEQELELALLLGSILLVTDGQGSAKAKATYDRARELSKALPPGPAVGRAVFGLWTYYLFQGLMGPTAELADEAVALSERSPDPGVRIMAHLAVSQTHMWTGQWQKCVEHFERVLSLYDPGQHQAYITHYAQNPRFTASNSGFWGEWMLGRPERAAAIAEAAIAEARLLDHDFTYTIAFVGRPLVAWFRRRHDEFLDSIDEYVASAQRAGNPFYVALSLSLEACAKLLRGEVDAGLRQLEEQYETMRMLGSKLVDPLIVSLLGEAHLAAGRYRDGIALLDESMVAFERDGRVSFLPDHLRLRAELLLGDRPDGHEEALTLLTRAVEAARLHGARSLELRAALAAARLLRSRGENEAARVSVAPVYAGFAEGLDDPDLSEARSFLS